jgi:hypothetical protein
VDLTFGNIGGSDTFDIQMNFASGSSPVLVSSVSITDGVPYTMDLSSGGDDVDRLLITRVGSPTSTFSLTNLVFSRV